MYLPDINIFCEKMGRKIGIEELAAEETPKQQELIVEENDIVEVDWLVAHNAFSLFIV